jgi:hypothetical protein
MFSPPLDELGISTLFVLAAALVVWVVSTSRSVFVAHPEDASAVNVAMA